MKSNSDLLIIIDGYLSDISRSKLCSNLIDQLKQVLPYKIALLNKYGYSWGLDSKVDYYLSHTEGFMLGAPPKELLDKKLYERPYVYVGTQIGMMENWLPLVGVQDHVANLYNTHLYTAETAKNLGFKKVFRIEADTIFDLEELKSLTPDLESFQDYILYGERSETGNWGKKHHFIADNHMIGYSVDLFKEFEIINNDKGYWDMCKKINYYGKWTEYIIPTIINYQKSRYDLKGISYPGDKYGSVRNKYPKSQFDVISTGTWDRKWDNIPKPCKISPNKHSDELNNKLGLFYWNEEKSPLEVKSKVVDKQGNEVYFKHITLNPFTWLYDEVDLKDELTLINTNIKDGEETEYTTWISQENILDLNTRFVKN